MVRSGSALLPKHHQGEGRGTGRVASAAKCTGWNSETCGALSVNGKRHAVVLESEVFLITRSQEADEWSELESLTLKGRRHQRAVCMYECWFSQVKFVWNGLRYVYL